MRGELDIRCDLKRRDQRRAGRFEGNLFKIQFRRVSKIHYGFLDRFSLGVEPVSGLSAMNPPSGARIRTAVKSILGPPSRVNGASPVRPPKTLKSSACVTYRQHRPL